MTTFQDPQPQSRRAARQSERADTAEPALGVYVEPSASRDMWDTTARRAAQLPAAQPNPESTPQSGGRRAAQPPAAVGEPLDYVTQQKPSIPTYDGPSFRPRGTTPPPADALPPTEALAQPDQPTFRRRDFSPEGRRAAPTAPGWTEPVEPLAPGARPTDLDYHTEARLAAAPAPIAEVPPTISPAPVAPQAPAAPPVSSVPENVVSEQTLTRREIRALQQAQAAAQVPELLEPLPPAPATPAQSDGGQAWPFAVTSPVSESLPTAPPEPAANTGLTNALSEFDWLSSQQDAVSEPPAPPAPEPQAVAPEPSAPAAVQPTPPAAEPAPESAPWTPPRGHWAAQLELDDETHPYENTINRTVGSGAVTTSALVLPTIPDGDIRGPLTGTGEIMLTGSIDLPQSYAATGASARLEHEGIDRLFESHDAEMVSTDSAPVSAIKAVSTQSGSNLSHAPKPKGTRALTALVIAAASMGVVVVGLLVVAFMLGGI